MCNNESLRQRSRCNVMGFAFLSTMIAGGFVLLLFLFALDPRFAGAPGFNGHWSNYLFGILSAISLAVTVWLWVRYGCWVKARKGPPSQYRSIASEKRQREPLVPRKSPASSSSSSPSSYGAVVPGRGYQQPGASSSKPAAPKQQPTPVSAPPPPTPLQQAPLLGNHDDDDLGIDPNLPAWAKEEARRLAPAPSSRVVAAPIARAPLPPPSPILDDLVDPNDPNLPAWARE